MHILVIGEDLLTLKLLDFSLREEGYAVHVVSTVRDAMALLQQEVIDLIVIDAKNPIGIEPHLAQQLRKTKRTLPILVIARGGSRADRITTLQHGADDYVAKPFEPSELIARVYALARRTVDSLAPELQTRLCIGVVCLDVRNQLLVHGVTGATVHLTKMEVQLLHVLMRNAGHVQSHDRLVTEAWGGDYGGSSNQLEVYIHRLRRRLREIGVGADFIRTVPGGNYEVPVEPAGP